MMFKKVKDYFFNEKLKLTLSKSPPKIERNQSEARCVGVKYIFAAIVVYVTFCTQKMNLKFLNLHRKV